MASIIDGDAEIFGGVFAGSLIIGTRAMSTMAEVGFAAGGTVAAADYDEGEPASAREPKGLRKLLPRSYLRMFFYFARGTVGDDNEGMFAGEIGVNEEGIKAGGGGLCPGNGDFAFDVMLGVCGEG